MTLTTHLHLAEITNAWNYSSTPQYVLVAWCLVKYRDFTLTLLLLLLPFTDYVQACFELTAIV